MKISLLLFFILLFDSYRAFSQDQMIKSEEAQFGSTLNLRPYKVYFKRDGKQYTVELPFKISEQATRKLLRLADVKNPRSYSSERDVEELYQKHVTGGDEKKYFDGSVKQWGQLDEAGQEKFKNTIMPKLKDYYLPLQDISFSDVMEMLIKIDSPSKDSCNCLDLNGVQIKTCE